MEYLGDTVSCRHLRVVGYVVGGVSACPTFSICKITRQLVDFDKIQQEILTMTQ